MASQILRADDQPKLLARMEHQTDWQQIDFDLDDRAECEFLNPVEAVDRDFVCRECLVQGPAARGLGHRTSGRPDSALRAGLASSMLVGLVVGRRLVRVPIIAEADTETLVALVAPAIQRVLT